MNRTNSYFYRVSAKDLRVASADSRSSVWGDRALQCDNEVTQAEYGSTASDHRPRDQTRFSPELQTPTSRKIQRVFAFRVN